MSAFAVFSDSSCDLPAKMVKENDVTVVPLKASFDGVNKFVEGVNITNDDFYHHIQTERIIPKTYFPTVKEYVTVFKERLECEQDVLCLCLSSKLSKSYYSALRAKEILSYNYPKNKVLIIDTLLASGAQGLMVLNAIKLQKESVDVETAYKKLMLLKESAVTIFTINSLDQLARGGRMSKATAMLATLLHINPIIHMEEGALVSREKAFGREKAIAFIGELAVSGIHNKIKDYDLCVFHSRSWKEAKQMEETLQNRYGAKSAIEPVEIGISIGSHTGASVVALSFIKRVETV